MHDLGEAQVVHPALVAPLRVGLVQPAPRRLVEAVDREEAGGLPLGRGGGDPVVPPERGAGLVAVAAADDVAEGAPGGAHAVAGPVGEAAPLDLPRASPGVRQVLARRVALAALHDGPGVAVGGGDGQAGVLADAAALGDLGGPRVPARVVPDAAGPLDA